MIKFDRRIDTGLPARFHWSDPKCDALSGMVDVLLDGVVLDEVASWDVGKGEITRKCRDSAGRLILGDDRAPTYETLRGLVEVRWVKDGAGAA
jgi:hypothetical protein